MAGEVDRHVPDLLRRRLLEQRQVVLLLLQPAVDLIPSADEGHTINRGHHRLLHKLPRDPIDAQLGKLACLIVIRLEILIHFILEEVRDADVDVLRLVRGEEVDLLRASDVASQRGVVL